MDILRFVSILFGMLRMTLLQLFSFGKVSFIYPVRFNRGAAISTRRGARVCLRKHVSLNNHVYLAATQNAKLMIGSYSGVGNNSVIVARDSITIGDNVMIGPNVCIYDHDHVFRKPGVMRDLGFTTAPVVIEDNVWIAAGVIILKGVHIGSGSVIGTGSIITKDIPTNTVVYGEQKLVMRPRFE